MGMKITIEDLQEIFSSVLGENVHINLDAKREDIIEWDSISQYNLILELENFYDILLTQKQIEKIISVRQLIEVLEKKIK